MFEKRLLDNIEYLFPDGPIKEIRRISGRICVLLEEGYDFDSGRTFAERVACIPGVARVSCGFQTKRELDLFYEAAACAMDEVGEFETFKVAARRNHTDFETDSMQMNQLVGAYLCEKFPEARVRMKDPDVRLCVEVVQNAAYIYALSIVGIGGLPVGTGGRVVCLLSSGFDSPVAMWRLARRGSVCHAVHFSGRPQTSATSEYLVDDIAHVLERSGCISRLYVVPFGDYQREIASVVPPELRVIIYRRLMFMVAERLAKKEKALALVTGESLGQVASQTLENISVTDASVDMPIFRPLIGTDKQDIMNDAQVLGTYEISAKDAPDCCTLFMPRNPETRARIKDVLIAEQNLPLGEWIDAILTEVEVHEYRCPVVSPSKKQK